MIDDKKIKGWKNKWKAKGKKYTINSSRIAGSIPLLLERGGGKETCILGGERLGELEKGRQGLLLSFQVNLLPQMAMQILLAVTR